MSFNSILIFFRAASISGLPGPFFSKAKRQACGPDHYLYPVPNLRTLRSYPLILCSNIWCGAVSSTGKS